MGADAGRAVTDPFAGAEGFALAKTEDEGMLSRARTIRSADNLSGGNGVVFMKGLIGSVVQFGVILLHWFSVARWSCQTAVRVFETPGWLHTIRCAGNRAKGCY